MVPVPVVVIPDGVLVKVHVPLLGKPLITMLPVGVVQLVWVMVPIIGAVQPQAFMVKVAGVRQLFEPANAA